MRLLHPAVAVLVAGPLASGCLEPTQILVEISTDARCADHQPLLTRIDVGAPGDPSWLNQVADTDRCAPGEPENRIGSLALVPHDDDRARVAFQVTTSLGVGMEACTGEELDDQCIVARRSLAFLPNTPLRVPVVMREACAGVVCPPDKTCVNGDCVSSEIDPRRCGDDGCGEDTLPLPALGLPWAQLLSTSMSGTPKGVAVDSQGNLIVAGTFHGSIEIGDDLLEADAGINDFFVASFTAEGEYRWSFQLGSAHEPTVDLWNIMAVGPDDAVYVTGEWRGTLVLDGEHHYTDTEDPMGDTFVLKLDTDGSLLWGRVHSGLGGLSLHDLVEHEGSLYVAGQFWAPVRLNGLELYGSSTYFDPILARFDAATGDFRWAQTYTGEINDRFDALAVDDAGHIHAVGRFERALSLGNVELSGDDLGDLFYARLDPTLPANGLLAAFGMPGPDTEVARGMGLSEDGRPCIAGNFHSQLTVGSETLVGAGADTMFASCLQADGEPVWAEAYNRGDAQSIHTASMDNRGFMYLVGDFNGTTTIGGVELTGGDDTAFVAVLNAATGVAEWARAFETTGSLTFFAMVAGDGGQSAYVAGHLDGSLDLGSAGQLVSEAQDLFVAHIVRP